jgi:hypothetical protein
MTLDTAPRAVVRDGSKMRLMASSGLLVEATTTARDGLLREFYTDYDRAFVLENEKEGYDGFAECLVLNSGNAYARVAKTFGAFREFVLVARDAETKARIGGANFIAFPICEADSSKATVLSINLNYVFINLPYRKRGFFKRLVGDLPDLAVRLFSTTNADDLPQDWLAPAEKTAVRLSRVLMFIEQNDPYLMSPKDYRLDTEFTGLDQISRIGIWARLGAKIVDFPYVQPPLSRDQGPDPNLVYALLGTHANALDACLLKGHLIRFFGISVLKGSLPQSEPTALRQLVLLEGMCAGKQPVNLLTVQSLDRAPLPDSREKAAMPPSLRDLLRAPNEFRGSS